MPATSTGRSDDFPSRLAVRYDSRTTALGGIMNVPGRPDSPAPGTFNAWFICVCFTVVGLYIVGLALGWIYIDPREIHVSRWVLALVGGVFILGGWVPVATQDGGNPRSGRLIFAALLVAFLLLSNWLLFHPDQGLRQAATDPGPHTTRYFLFYFHSSHMLWPEKYDRLATVLLWDIPMVSFALWLLFGGRRRERG